MVKKTKEMVPASPGHSLVYINTHMQTEEILRELHEWMIPRRKEIEEGKRQYEAPLITLQLAIRRVLKMVKNGEIVPLHQNPFNEEFRIKIQLHLDLDKATENDVKLLKQQLKELDKIYQELEKTGYWEHQREV